MLILVYIDSKYKGIWHFTKENHEGLQQPVFPWRRCYRKWLRRTSVNYRILIVPGENDIVLQNQS